MHTWLKAIIPGLVVAAIVFLFFDLFTGNTNKQFYKVYYNLASKSAGTVEQEEQITQEAISVLRRRVWGLGYDDSITRSGSNTLEIVINEVEDTLVTDQAISENSQLEIRELYSLSELAKSFSSISKTVQRILKQDSAILDTDGKFLSRKMNIGSLIAFSLENGRTTNAGTIGVVRAQDTALINKIFREPEILSVFPADLVFAYGVAESASKGKSKHDFLYLYGIKTKNEESKLDSWYIVTAVARKGNGGNPEIRFGFDDSGSRIWLEMTTENKGRHIAIIVNQVVVSAPMVHEPIAGGNCVIAGGFTFEEAELLARQLRNGYLPSELSIIKKEIIAEARPVRSNKPFITLITFLVAGTIAFFIFKALKSRSKPR